MQGAIVSRGYNFSAGPAGLPTEVLRRIAEELPEWGDTGASVMEISHRSAAFIALAEEAEHDLRDLLAVPAEYRVLFLPGGATQHFAQLPMNLAAPGQAADYLLSGHWGEKAFAQARHYCAARIAASSAETNFVRTPRPDEWQFDGSAAYVHFTSNETIHGVQFHEVPAAGNVPLVADMSSDILSRPLDVSRFGVIYASAQKNIGASGLSVMIVREDLLARCPATIAPIFRYAAFADSGSMPNTPNTFGWYVAALVFKWLQRQGGLVAMGERNAAKARLLYDAIDASGGWYRNPVDTASRSLMNVPFTLRDPSLDAVFLAEAKAAGLLALKGHRAVGGMRASIYNAMPIEGVAALVDFMHDFARRHG
jgi:phosphoserine aminotransferase